MYVSETNALTGPRGVQPTHAALRELTRLDHDGVDAAFTDFDLTLRADYAAFLSAHARVLPDLERRMAAAGMIAPGEGRTALLVADLHALDRPLPPEMSVDLPAGEGALWGALYVVEGSRLGGAILAKRVGAGLPGAYLGARHEAGSWKRVLGTIEAAAGDAAWSADAVTGAKMVFAAYRSAADEEQNLGR